jgi:hypothetical protein
MSRARYFELLREFAPGRYFADESPRWAPPYADAPSGLTNAAARSRSVMGR